MDKKFLDIITIVLDEIRENANGDIDLQNVIEVLEDEGFSEDEISFVMTWIMNHGDQIDRITTEQQSTIPRPVWRSLNEIEAQSISPKAFSYLFHLRELHILTDDNMEQVIDRAVDLRFLQMSIEDIKDLVAAVVLNFEDSAAKGYFQFTSTHYPH
ncbi:DUF494 family protein [candidate division KSB1 bacterium]|nr:DUF494 family protein [candidate division KSB1 bacterium]RQW02691.1 MAG: DUF494 family protein [candidate division KSB1 bacterium]